MNPIRLRAVNADVSLYPGVDLGQSYNELTCKLIDDIIWRQETVTIYGKSYFQPRLSAWYGDRGAIYSYSGINMEPHCWTPTLHSLKKRIELLVQQEFNSVLLNYYRDQQDSMGMHSDDEPELGDQPVIASLSLGEERTFLLRHKTKKNLNTIKLPLPSGSLLIMKGKTQRYWKHGIAKEIYPCGPRLNLTFRRILKN